MNLIHVIVELETFESGQKWIHLCRNYLKIYPVRIRRKSCTQSCIFTSSLNSTRQIHKTMFGAEKNYISSEIYLRKKLQSNCTLLQSCSFKHRDNTGNECRFYNKFKKRKQKNYKLQVNYAFADQH